MNATLLRATSLGALVWSLVGGIGFADPSPGFCPANGSREAYPDGDFSVEFDGPPVLNPGGAIELLDGRGGVVDTLRFVDETQTPAPAVTVNVGSQLVRLVGNTLWFTPHFEKLAYRSDYSVRITAQAVTGSLRGKPFVGIGPGLGEEWTFTTRGAPTLGPSVTVDGSPSSTADFRSVGAALRSLADHPLPGVPSVTIHVAPGVYTELLYYKPLRPDRNLTITLEGPGGTAHGDSCTVQFLNGNTVNKTINTRATFFFTGANLVLQNLSFVNLGVRSAVGQAETLCFASGEGFTLAAGNCSFRSNQDTLQTSGRNWFWDCFIEGNVDFIWGRADAALFQHCQLHVRSDGGSSYSLFVARTGVEGAPQVGKGYVLADSTVSLDDKAVVYYGRRAGGSGFYDQVTLINNVFSGQGRLGTGLWMVKSPPLTLGDSRVVGWKAAGNSGLGAESQGPTAAGSAASIDSQEIHWATRDQILNEDIVVNRDTLLPDGYQTVANPWDTSILAKSWGAVSGSTPF